MTSTDGARGALSLADEAMTSGRIDDAVVHLSAAVRASTAAGDNRAGAMTCARLGDVFQSMLGNKVAARPWFVRALRLVEHEEPCVEQGWVAIAPMGCDVDDPAVLLERAELALDRARRFGDVDLEVKALADGGLAHVHAGRVSLGMGMLDEAMALACGGGTEDAGTVGKSVCSFYTACYHTADFERVESWTRAFHQRGILGPAAGPQAFLSSHCDSVRASLLCGVGRWSEAEDLLVRAHKAIEDLMPGAAWHTPIALAELRILQGRLDEAEALLLGLDDFLQALVPTARLHLARGDFALACAVARRGLRMVARDRVRAGVLLGVVVEAELGRGDLERAAEASSELDARVGGLELAPLVAEAARVRARLQAAQGSTAEAIDSLHDALALLGGADLPLQRMALHLDAAGLLEEVDPSAALVEGRSAVALLRRLDVVLLADHDGLLRRLGLGDTERRSPPCRVATLERSGAWWTIGCGDTKVRLRGSKGLSYLADLIEHAGRDRHVFDLVDKVEGLSVDRLDRRHLGDAGVRGDSQARDTYRRQVAALRDEVEDALAVEDDERAARFQVQLDAVVAELARTFGLGGRERRASSAAEKARVNVTRALRTAVENVVDALPEAGAVLDRRVRTGAFCAYQPHPDDEVTWSVHT